MTDKLLLNCEEVQESFGISRTTLYNLVHTQGFPTFKLRGRRVFPTEALRAWCLDQLPDGIEDDDQ